MGVRRGFLFMFDDGLIGMCRFYIWRGVGGGGRGLMGGSSSGSSASLTADDGGRGEEEKVGGFSGFPCERECLASK